MRARKRNILDYKSYPETKSCYLDGRYFNLVLTDLFPQLRKQIHHPMTVSITSDEKNISANVSMPYTELRNDINIIRVIIETKFMRHSSLLLINPTEERVWMWDALTEENINDEGIKTIRELVQEGIKNYLKDNFEKDLSFEYGYQEVLKVEPEGCPEGGVGYCNAYVLKRTLDWILEKETDLSSILNFVSAVEDNYRDKLIGSPDVEYYYRGRGFGGGFGGAGLGLGLLGGVALGAALAPRPAYYPAYYPAYPAYPYGYGYGYYA